jgi:YD repeat-containing protein
VSAKATQTNRITYIWYEDNQNNVLAGDGYAYNNFDQVTTHLLKNGAFESFVYDGRGLLTDKYNPKFNAIPSGTDPHPHYTYYTSGPWTDRVLTVTLPANYPQGLQASETYEYDRALGPTASRT